MFERKAVADCGHGITIIVDVPCDHTTPRQEVIEEAQKIFSEYSGLFIGSGFWRVMGMN